MPTYTFRNKTTKEEWTDFLSMSERLIILSDPNIEQVVAAPAIVSGIAKKPDAGFNDVLKRIKSHHYGSVVRTF